MGAAAITFDEGEKHTVSITVPADLPLTGYTPRIEVRSSAHSDIVASYQTTLSVNGQIILLTIPATDFENKCGDYQWQLMLFKAADATDVIKFTADNFTVSPAIVQKATA